MRRFIELLLFLGMTVAASSCNSGPTNPDGGEGQEDPGDLHVACTINIDGTVFNFDANFPKKDGYIEGIVADRFGDSGWIRVLATLDLDDSPTLDAHVITILFSRDVVAPMTLAMIADTDFDLESEAGFSYHRSPSVNFETESVSGTVHITSYEDNRVTGTFSGTCATKDGAVATITNGRFDVELRDEADVQN